MDQLIANSRLARAVAELAIRSHSAQMPFCVTPSFGARNAIISIRDVARALGYRIVEGPMPLNPDVDVTEIERRLSADLAGGTGPTLVLLFAHHHDGGRTHREIVARTARLASDSWSDTGRTFLIVISPQDPEPLARLVGESLGRHDWAAAIPL